MMNVEGDPELVKAAWLPDGNSVVLAVGSDWDTDGDGEGDLVAYDLSVDLATAEPTAIGDVGADCQVSW
jgi:hypothetical protein